MAEPSFRKILSKDSQTIKIKSGLPHRTAVGIAHKDYQTIKFMAACRIALPSGLPDGKQCPLII
jgi:hypothetical protein